MVCPIIHQSSELVLELLKNMLGAVVAVGKGAAVPRVLVELFPALQEGVLGLFESIIEGLLVLISTFDILVGSNIFLKLPRYFIPSILQKF